ncbi:MAG: right-handed parallel beta-helix repeat-containing protein [Candidatus Aureabacteria bacterium]|nr:right-handed parallel beta-helix repeat-containing protein [Candidatus Auribacterota bacterium]
MKRSSRLFFIPGIACGAIFTLIHCQTAAARELVVDASGEEEYRIIQEAIDDASPGDVVKVKSGRYRDYFIRNIPGHGNVWGAVFLKSNVSVIGEGADDTVIEGVMPYSSTVPTQNLGVVNAFGADGARLSGFTIVAYSDEIYTFSGAYGVYGEHSDNLIIDNNFIDGRRNTGTCRCFDGAIRLLGCNASIYRNTCYWLDSVGIELRGWDISHIYNNTLYGHTEDGMPYAMYGMDLAGGSSPHIWNNIIAGYKSGIGISSDSSIVSGSRSNNFWNCGRKYSDNRSGDDDLETNPVFIDNPEWVFNEKLNLGLKNGSPLIDRGAMISGLVYAGSAPEVGAYEKMEGDAGSCIVDDGSENYFESGSGWTGGNASPGYYGSGYRYHAGGAASASARWSYPGTIPFSGVYEVRVIWSAGSNRATNAPYEVMINGTPHQTLRGEHGYDQRSAGGQWHTLGAYTLDVGDSLAIRLRCNANNYVIADAVRFLFKGDNFSGPIIVDNSNTDAFLIYGDGWSRGSAPVPYGSDYLYHVTTARGDESNFALWSAIAPVEGDYVVWAYWVPGQNRTADATYLVEGGNSVAEVGGNQTVAGCTWNRLDELTNVQKNQKMDVSLFTGSSHAGSYVIADAVMFVYKDPSMDYIVDDADAGFELYPPAGWTRDSLSPNRYGPCRRYSLKGDGENYAVWTVNIEEAGWYELYVWYTGSSNNTSTACYEFWEGRYASLIGRKCMNQRVTGGPWNRIGEYMLQPGMYTSRLSNTHADGYVIADAFGLKRRRIGVPFSYGVYGLVTLDKCGAVFMAHTEGRSPIPLPSGYPPYCPGQDRYRDIEAIVDYLGNFIGYYALSGDGHVYGVGRTPAGIGQDLAAPGPAAALKLNRTGDGLYVLLNNGSVWAEGSNAPTFGYPELAGGNQARDIELVHKNGRVAGYYILDSYGQVYAYPEGALPLFEEGPIWAGQDRARDLEIVYDGTTGVVSGYYVLDGWGAIRARGNVPSVAEITRIGYEAPNFGWDIARKIKLIKNRETEVTGIYLCDGTGVIHPIGLVEPFINTGLWPGSDIIRGMDIVGDSFRALR